MGFIFLAVQPHESLTRISFTKLQGMSSYSVLQMYLRAGLPPRRALLNDMASTVARSMASHLPLLWGIWPFSSDVALSTMIQAVVSTRPHCCSHLCKPEINPEVLSRCEWGKFTLPELHQFLWVLACLQIGFKAQICSVLSK